MRFALRQQFTRGKIKGIAFRRNATHNIRNAPPRQLQPTSTSLSEQGEQLPAGNEAELGLPNELGLTNELGRTSEQCLENDRSQAKELTPPRPRRTHRRNYRASSALQPALQMLLKQMHQLRPRVMPPEKLKELFQGAGRQELNSLVGDCVDAILLWSKVLSGFESEFLRANQGVELTEAEVEVILEARWILLRLRQQIQILEMVADAQRTLQALQKAKLYRRLTPPRS